MSKMMENVMLNLVQHLIPYLTVIENVMLPLSITGKSNREQFKMAEEILKRIGLKGKERMSLPGT